ncbi:hypothetical protein C8Q80DRAFT_1273536 [Daedaleopsis nitida]|nr:hypothetical protein C8Q80DRAFT_1273536 [Daedaleopsis nitida]
MLSISSLYRFILLTEKYALILAGAGSRNTHPEYVVFSLLLPLPSPRLRKAVSGVLSGRGWKAILSFRGSQACAATPNAERILVDVPDWASKVDLNALRDHAALKHVTIRETTRARDYRCTITMSDLVPLSHPPALEYLSIAVNFDPRLSGNHTPVKLSLSLAALKHLELGLYGTWGDAIGFFLNTHLPCLRALVLTVTQLQGALQFFASSGTSYDSLAERMPQLASLRLCVETRDNIGRDRTSLRLLFEPFLSLRELRDVALDVFTEDFNVCYTADDLQAVAQAWPALEAFGLKYMPAFRRTAPETVAPGLECPSTRSVSRVEPAHQLQVFKVDVREDEVPACVAQFVKRVFPFARIEGRERVVLQPYVTIVRE